MNIPLCVFSWPLANLTLRGGKGLPPAWGPLADADGALCSWHPYRSEVFNAGDYTTTDPTSDTGSWSLPLDADSPWPARLAMISTWLADPSRVMPSCVRDNGDGTISLTAWDGSDILWEARWTTGGVAVEPTDRPGLNLPTLAQHLQAYPLIVALPLALYDVPEVRARVAL